MVIKECTRGNGEILTGYEATNRSAGLTKKNGVNQIHPAENVQVLI